MSIPGAIVIEVDRMEASMYLLTCVLKVQIWQAVS